MPGRQARQLRYVMTDAERRLWSALRGRRLEGCKFCRQHPLGPFVLDFACVAHHLVVEVDGGQHADSEADRSRTAWLESQGWRVIRFWNNEVLSNIDGVAATILAALEAPHPPGPEGPGPSLSH
ncbi:endonuclease domain-containing protein [Magnetospirillum sp. SS-4]|uniref:endonuclease domain-containing protein n=1 Tax=Magnetospirillum sp. SS-4 TaxID=2681465 RepID=UPI001571A59B|nr:endonuclease domain-containing protein [Magnetospirillum sp. SS-4]